jgi:uncharacterized protein (UPF0332 family)
LIDLGPTFPDKARESLEGARLAYEGGRYNNSANRSYYACLQSAIHALIAAQVNPSGDSTHGTTVWNHGFVQRQFNGLLIHRRHRYGADLRSVLSANYELRVQADYSAKAVSEIAAFRALRRAESFVDAILQREGGQR